MKSLRWAKGEAIGQAILAAVVSVLFSWQIGLGILVGAWIFYADHRDGKDIEI